MPLAADFIDDPALTAVPTTVAVRSAGPRTDKTSNRENGPSHNEAAGLPVDEYHLQRINSLSSGSMSDRERAFLSPSSYAQAKGTTAVPANSNDKARSPSFSEAGRRVSGASVLAQNARDARVAELEEENERLGGRNELLEADRQARMVEKEAYAGVGAEPPSPSGSRRRPGAPSGISAAECSSAEGSSPDGSTAAGPTLPADVPGEPAQQNMDLSGGAHISDEEKAKRGRGPGGTLRRRGVRERVLHFTPSWFSVTMGTGVITTLLLLLGSTWPSLKPGLKYPALVWSIGSVIIYIAFAAMFLARYIMYPQVLPLTIKHSQKSMFLGTPVMGLVTIISGIAQLGTREFNLGISWTLVMTGFWWLTAALSLLTSIGIPWSMMTYQEHYFEGTTAALLLPIVPPITVAAVGSTLCDLLMEYGGTQYDTYAWTILIVSYLVLGIGLPLAMFVLVLYFQRLLLFNSPPREIIISCMLPLGPCGQGGEATLHLGEVAYKLFPRISQPADVSGVPQLIDVGQAMYAAGLFSALALWALGVWWTVIAVLTILRERRRGTLPFNMGWWSMTFPVASMAICTARLAITLNSLALKITYTGWVIANVVFWLTVSIPTAKGFWSGELFQAPCIASLPLKP